jgi:colanic acid/amylovoran biosynthesis protein
VADDALRIGVFGMSPDTGNMGVSALYKSFIATMASRLPACEFVVFDNGLGARRANVQLADRQVPVSLCGVRGGRRYFRPENLATISMMADLGVAGRANYVLRAIDSCAVIMDVSAGDSFSDIYGQSRFRNIVLPKIISAKRSRRLLLLPQTYGPFSQPSNAKQARQAVLHAQEAWARDTNSYDILTDLLRGDFDPERHRLGVDLAFGLPAVKPPATKLDDLDDWLSSGELVLGFNVSGLIWHLRERATEQFGFNADYHALVRQFIEWILANTDARILMIPHVNTATGHYESDLDAIEALTQTLPSSAVLDDRVRIAPPGLDEQQLKWLIASCHWFCGTRMHSTIAGLSSGVPTASIVYSDKAAGVFASCGQAEHIVDPRRLDTEDALDCLIGCFLNRKEAELRLREALKGIQLKIDEQANSFIRFALNSSS